MKVVHTGITDPDKIKKVLEEEGYFNIFSWCDSPGSFYDWHTHPYEEVRWVYEGEVVMGTEYGEVILKPGDRLDLPAGTKHWAKSKNGVCYICGSK